MNRRQLLQTVTGAAMTGLAGSMAEADRREKTMAVTWPIGCFSRPWSNWSYDEALDGMKAAGFQQIGLLGDHKGEAFLYPEATPDYLDTLKKRIEDHGLTAIFGRMRTRHDVPLDEVKTSVHKQIENAARLNLKYLMTLGTDKPEEYENFYTAMTDAAAYSQTHHIQLVFKPHGGCTASAGEMLHCREKVNHPNFHLWYDAGNIIYYTGKDPVADVERVAKLVTGFCAKDCARPKSEVMIQFGEGKVDFRGVFQKLKAAGFHGPVMIECCGGHTLNEVTANARANRLFLEELFASL